MMRGTGWIIAAAVVLSWLGGCASDPKRGYSLASAHDTSISTISVPIFENLTPMTGLETQLTEAIIKEIQRRTPWAVVPVGSAQTTLTGKIRKAEFVRLSRTPGTGLAQEATFELTLDFDWSDDASGRSRVRQSNVRAIGTFVAARGVGERIEVGEKGAIQVAARRIVEQLRADW
ncbi:MAG: hypothetical protein H6811_02615 [Phycisphaeraceae bacterium]|nr:hypothetical protein [Phycisphaeraceae bacterium]